MDSNIINISDCMLGSDNYPYTLNLKRDTIDDVKELSKFIKSCEAIIRKSPEYKIWTDYIRDVLGFIKCELTDEIHYQTYCDIHHHPVSLYAIVKSIVSYYISSNKSFCSLDISYDVLNLHYNNNIGYISILSSLHQKFHNGYLNLPMELVNGNYKYFIDNYMMYLEEDDIDIIKKRLSINYQNCGYTTYYWYKKEAA